MCSDESEKTLRLENRINMFTVAVSEAVWWLWTSPSTSEGACFISGRNGSRSKQPALAAKVGWHLSDFSTKFYENHSPGSQVIKRNGHTDLMIQKVCPSLVQ